MKLASDSKRFHRLQRERSGRDQMRIFSNSETDQKYRKLGFTQADLSLKLTVGGVSVYAGEDIFKGVRLTFESFAPRSMSQYDVSLPEKCSVEQIAGLIFANVALNHRESAAAWQVHFTRLGMPLFSVNCLRSPYL